MSATNFAKPLPADALTAQLESSLTAHENCQGITRTGGALTLSTGSANSFLSPPGGAVDSAIGPGAGFG